jgi:hypothetical protein
MQFDDHIQILGIRTWGYIQEIKKYGPCGKIVIKVEQLINMLNRGIDVVIKETSIKPLYMLIKEYNLLNENNDDINKATKAEEFLGSKLIKDYKKIDDLFIKNNPLEDDTTEEEKRNIEISADTVNMKAKKKLKRHLLFKETKITTSNNNDHEYNDIDFDI